MHTLTHAGLVLRNRVYRSSLITKLKENKCNLNEGAKKIKKKDLKVGHLTACRNRFMRAALVWRASRTER